MDDSDEIDERFKDLLAPSLIKGGLPIVNNSANSTNECDSDDPFEDILASRRSTNCSRSRTDLGLNDIHTFPSTPLRQSSSLTDSDNLPQTEELFNSERKSGGYNAGFNISYSPTASILRKTPEVLLSPSALTNHSKPISSFKKYSMMKTALAAKKEFEDLVKSVALKKALKEKLVSPGDDNVHNKLKSTLAKNSSFGTLAHSSSRIDSPSPARPSNTGNNSTTFVSCLDESASDERKSCQSLLNTPTSHGENVENTPLPKAYSKNGATSSTDPATQNILQGVVAYVEIKSGKEYRNEGTQAELESWGAKVEKNLTKKVTHCFFHGGKMSSFRKAVEMKVPLVSTLWIEECKEHLRQMPLKGFEPHGIEKYYEELPLYLLKPKIRRPRTDSKVPSKTWKKLAGRDKAEKPSGQPGKTRRPMTDSKIPSKTWKKLAGRDKAEKPADKPSAQPEKADKLKTALHSVAGDFQKASQHFDKILKSPALQKRSEKSETSSNSSKRQKNSTKTNLKGKKLIFNSSSDEDNENKQEKLEEKLLEKDSAMDDSSFELRSSDDSEDLRSDKKQAATNRCSGPGRLLTSWECKRLVALYDKPPNNAKMQFDMATNVLSTAKKQASAKTKKEKSITGEDLEKESNKQKAKKRKLLMNSDFGEDSRENTPELPERRPYVATPGGAAKPTMKPKSKPTKLKGKKVEDDPSP